MFKKQIATLLAGIMLAGVLSACGNGSAPAPAASSGASQEAAEEAPADEETAAEEGSSGETADESVISFDEDPYEVSIKLLTLGANDSSIPEMEEQINAVMVPAINAKIKIEPIPGRDYRTKISLAIQDNEKLDIFFAGGPMPVTSCISNEYAMDITDLLKERGSTILEKEGVLLDAYTVDGRIYGVSMDLYPAVALGIHYNADMLEEAGLTAPEEWTMESLTELGLALKEKLPDKYLMMRSDGHFAGDIASFYGIEYFGNVNCSCGVFLDPEKDQEIVNLFTSDLFREYCLNNITWKEAGLVPADQATSMMTPAEMYQSGQAFCDWVLNSPTQAVSDGASYSFNTRQAAFSNPRLSTSAAQERAFIVADNCERPDKAVDVINFIFENKDVANILNYGIEGKDWEFVEGSDQIIRYPEGVTGENVGWNRIVAYFGDGMDIAAMQPATDSFFEELKAFNDSAVVTSSFGYTFDASEYQNELANCNAVVTEYISDLMYGEISADELDAYLEKFNSELEIAGINDIIAENQKQFEAWLAAK